MPNNNKYQLLPVVNVQNGFATPHPADSPFTLSSPQRTSWLKTGVAFCLALVAALVNHLAHIWTNQRMPRIDPLPELWFEYFPEYPWAMRATELIMFFLIANGIIMILISPSKSVILTRYFLITGLCYSYRAVGMFLIQPPEPSKSTLCDPPIDNLTVTKVLHLTAGLVMSGTLEWSKHSENLCGDLIISGHTFSLMLPYLTIDRYGSKNRFFRVIGRIGMPVVLVGMALILLARRHYMIDVAFAYYLATRLFWTYHSFLKYPNSELQKVWWFEIFRFFEDANLNSNFEND